MAAVDRFRSRPQTGVTPWVVVLALAVTLLMNALATALPLAGRSTGEVSDLFPVMITPAGFTFSIWGVIYLALLAFAVYQALPGRRREPWLGPLRWLFVASCLFNVAWLLAWHYLYTELSLLFMAGLLISLVLMYRRIRRGTHPSGAAERWCVRVPVSLYLGWITVASVVNTRVVLYELGWTGGGMVERLVTVMAVAAIAALALWMLARRRDMFFAAVVIWAAIGIYAANAETPSVAFGAVAAALVVLVGVLWTSFMGARSAS